MVRCSTCEDQLEDDQLKNVTYFHEVIQGATVYVGSELIASVAKAAKGVTSDNEAFAVNHVKYALTLFLTVGENNIIRFNNAERLFS